MIIASKAIGGIGLPSAIIMYDEALDVWSPGAHTGTFRGNQLAFVAGSTGDLLDLAVEKRIVEKSGAWFAYSGERLGQGRENAKQFLKENPDITRAIEDRVRRELGLTRDADPAV